MTTLEQQATLHADVPFALPPAREDSGRSAAVRIGGPSLSLLGTSSEAASLRNTTVLPKIEHSGGAIRIQPRSEARYQRIRRLGAGAMGEVTLVKDNDIGRTVAVKQLLAPTENPDGIARFIEEIRTIGQLEHPNIVPIHDVGVDEQGQLFFVMKHIDGETLESILEKLAAGDPQTCARYTLDVRIEIFMGLLHALQAAHEKGIVHRDIKPANIMIGRFGEVVLMDWGIAKLMPQSGLQADSLVATQQGQLVGTVKQDRTQRRRRLQQAADAGSQNLAGIG